MKRGLLLSAIIIFAGLMTGCSRIHLAKANRDYEKLRYDAAIENYRRYLTKNDDPDIRLKIAESCVKINRFHEAVEELGKVREQNNSQNYWLIKGRSYMSAGKYDSAEVAFKNYLEKNPKNAIAEKLCISCSWIYSKMQDSSNFEVHEIKLSGFNNYFSATHYNKGIIFTGGGNDILNENNVKGEDYNLYYLEKDDKGNYKDPVALSGEINGQYHESCPCIKPDDSQLVFTRSKEHKKFLKDGKLHENLKILFADYKDNSWKGVKEFPYNDPKYSVGQPALSQNHQLFFFVSDKPGGKGGTDIYYSIMTGGGFTEPVNIGETVNTTGNEMFPWYNEADSCLYFASEGHQNFGGLDIFKVKIVDGVASIPENLGFPINSSKDDYSYLLNKDGRTGYLSSNRSGNDKLYEVVLK